MKLSDWKADETLVEVVDGYADGMPPIDKQVSIMGRELLQVCNNDGALAFAGAVQAYVEACAYAAQLKQERDTWKANHDNQVKLKAAIASRPDLGERAAKVEEMAKVIERLTRERDGLAQGQVARTAIAKAERATLQRELDEMHNLHKIMEGVVNKLTAERDSLSRRVEALERQVEAMAQ